MKTSHIANPARQFNGARSCLVQLTVVLCVICIMTGLSFSSAYAGEIWIALLDLSGSMGEGTDSTLSANISAVGKMIAEAEKDTTIIVQGFGRRADVRLLKVVTPHIAGPKNVNLRLTKEAAVKKLKENLASKGGTIDKSKTGLHGAILRASRLMGEDTTVSAKRLYIFSDMLENESFQLSIKGLKTSKSSDKVISRLETSGFEYPDLKGVEVYCYSRIIDSKNMDTVSMENSIRELRSFWTRYFQKSGSVLKAYKTTLY